MRKGNLYTVGFVLAVAAACSLVLATASQTLRKRQVLAQEADMKRNILSAVGIRKCPLNAYEARKEISEKECIDIRCCYRDHIRSFMVNHRGDTIKNSTVNPEQVDIEKEMEKPPEERLYPVFVRISDNRVHSYCVPVYGKGLWSSIYGYCALKPDFTTVAGVTFYRQGETPGLGAEIQSEWFQNNFRGKKIRDRSGELVSVTVVKGRVDTESPRAAYQVDGISGATLTGNGVTRLLKHSLGLYEPFFRKTLARGHADGI